MWEPFAGLLLDFRMPLLSFSRGGAGSVPAPVRSLLDHSFSFISNLSFLSFLARAVLKECTVRKDEKKDEHSYHLEGDLVFTIDGFPILGSIK